MVQVLNRESSEVRLGLDDAHASTHAPQTPTHQPAQHLIVAHRLANEGAGMTRIRPDS
jgi:hypothetical protein